MKKVRQKQILYDITYMWNPKNTNESIYKQKQTQPYKTNILSKRKSRKGGVNQYGINGYKVL